MLDDHEYLDEDAYYSDEESYNSSDDFDVDSDIELSDNNPYAPPHSPTVTRWMLIELEGVQLLVSNMGRVRHVNSLYDSCEGIHLHGTPFMIYQLQTAPGIFKNYLMHELVWQAFNGAPPDGWVIRHKYEYTRHTRKVYKNKLANITIVPDRITPLYIERGLPGGAFLGGGR